MKRRPDPLPKQLHAWTEIIDSVPVTFNPLVPTGSVHMIRPESFARRVPVNEGTETRSPEMPAVVSMPMPPREPDISYTRENRDTSGGTTTTGAR